MRNILQINLFPTNAKICDVVNAECERVWIYNAQSSCYSMTGSG